jgi:hypothetical protein
MPIPVRSIRLQRRSSQSLDTLSGAAGEIFFDSDRNTLRLYTANQSDNIILADRVWVEENTFSGDYNDLTNRPTQFSGLSTLSFATGSVVNEFSNDATLADASTSAVPTELAVKTYVDNAVLEATPDIDISTLDAIGDVDTTTEPLVNGQLLQWDGEKWQNATIGSTSDTTYDLTSTSVTGGVSLTLSGSDDSSDVIEIVGAGDTTVSVNLLGQLEIATSITQYTDADAQAAFTAGTGITITDGEIATSITQYTDADAQAAFTAGTGISITDGEIATTITQYTDADAQAAVTATDVGLGNVTNESKATMFTDPTFTGTVTTSALTSASTITLTAPDGIINTGQVTFNSSTREAFDYYSSPAGTVSFDLDSAGVFWLNNPQTAITANFINVPTDINNVISVAVVCQQGAGSNLPTTVQIDGVTQSILWQGGNVPTGTANSIDVVSFTFATYSLGFWTVLGSLTNYDN